MTYTTLISTKELAAHLDNPDWAVFDCRFVLQDPAQGRRSYQEAHIPTAVYADLDEDLCGPIIPGATGRHPLPSVEAAATTFSRWGIDSKTQVVAYDDRGGAVAASRLWWMLRWLGHDRVSVLDGGWQQWQKENRPTREGDEQRAAREFNARVRPELVVDADDILTSSDNPRFKVFDSRAADRYRGENETLDSVAGHVPGAISAPYVENLGEDGLFKSQDILRTRYQSLLGDLPPDQSAFYCGSGVTAAHSVLAVLHAGLGEAKLYSGSWSDWILDPARPVATGDSVE